MVCAEVWLIKWVYWIKLLLHSGKNLMDVDSKSQSFYLEEIQENTDDLLISKNSKYFKFSLESAGLSLGGILVATMVEDELEHLYMTIVTKHLKVLSVEWDLSKNNLLDGLKIRDVTGNHEYYSDWPQTCVALELQRESCASKIAVYKARVTLVATVKHRNLIE